MSHRAALISILTSLLAAGPGSAQAPVQLSKAKTGTLANLVTVPVPWAGCAAVGDAANCLAFGHEKSYPHAHVSVVRLDAKGNPAAYSIPLKLPKPAGMVKNANYTLCLTFHPKLPLLYVWQDIDIAYVLAVGLPNADLAQFDHLLIYDVAKETPELLASLCRGPEYMYGCTGGAIQADSGGDFLYVPNLRDPKQPGVLKVGRFALDENGLPRLEDDKDAKLPLPARLKRLAELNAVTPLSPHQISPQEHVYLFPYNPVGCGQGFHAASRDAVIVGSWNGLVTWRPDDKQVALSGLSIRASGRKFLSAHPILPLVFVSVYNSDVVFRMEHGEGYLSQLPQAYVFPEASFFTPPALMSKSKKLAMGGRWFVYVVDLDEQGRCRPELTRVQVLNSAVMALVYSERHDRLYVSVEISK